MLMVTYDDDDDGHCIMIVMMWLMVMMTTVTYDDGDDTDAGDEAHYSHNQKHTCSPVTESSRGPCFSEPCNLNPHPKL